MKKVKFEFTITGFIIAIVLVGMFTFSFGYFTSSLEDQYSIVDNTTLSSYNNFDKIQSFSQDIQANATSIKQQTGLLDVIGGFFSNGYSALKITYQSFDLYKDITDQAAEDIPEFTVFRDYLNLIILIGLFVGVGIAVLVKWKV